MIMKHITALQILLPMFSLSILSSTVSRRVHEICSTMIPPSPPPSNYSSCWQWWTPPKDGFATDDMPAPTKGCDYKPCQDAVCACDSYCCDVAWDESCRGYHQEDSNEENNYFVDGCSAKILCCESKFGIDDSITNPAPSSKVIKIPVAVPFSVPVAVPSLKVIKVPIAAPVLAKDPNQCETIGASPPPLDSTCWKWWTPPKGGIATDDMPEPQKGCDCTPCQDAVCACDSYCCDTAWDQSCRGVEGNADNSCSAKLLCCESKLDKNDLAPSHVIKVPIAVPTNVVKVPVAVPAPSKRIKVPLAVPYAVPIAVPIAVPVPSSKVVKVPIAVPVATPYAVPIAAPVPSSKFIINVPIAVSTISKDPYQCTSETDSGCCNTIGAFPPPIDSTCWKWWTPPKDRIATDDMPDPPLGCDYKPCEDAVCACDSYCCDVAWDESCRGYKQEVESNSCSAKILCCESKLDKTDPAPSHVIKVPIAIPTNVIKAPVAVPYAVPVVPAPSSNVVKESIAAPVTSKDPNQCTSETDSGCCDNIGAFPPPVDSTCWQWWTPPKGGIKTEDMPEPPLGCDYKPCEDAVCACDSYCCDTAWDGACRGHQNDSSENNYFVHGCSAKILCCESKLFEEVPNYNTSPSQVSSPSFVQIPTTNPTKTITVPPSLAKSTTNFPQESVVPAPMKVPVTVIVTSMPKVTTKLSTKTSKKYAKAPKSTKGSKSTTAIKAKPTKGKGKGNHTKNVLSLVMNVTDDDWLD